MDFIAAASCLSLENSNHHACPCAAMLVIHTVHFQTSPNTDILQEVITKIRKPYPIELHVETDD